jgi:hypothetical protein
MDLLPAIAGCGTTGFFYSHLSLFQNSVSFEKGFRKTGF